MKKKSPLQLLGLLLVLAIFALAVWLLKHEVDKNDLTFAKIYHSLLQIPAWQMLTALGLTLVNFAVILVCYDYLAFRFAEVPISLRRVAFAALTAYPISYNFGATVAGIPLRYRLYSAWGIPLTKIVQLLVILALTFWFGVFFISGVLFVATPLRIPHNQLHLIAQAMAAKIPPEAVDWFTYLFADSRPFGILLLLLAGSYMGASLFHRGSLKLFRWTLPVPPFRLTVYQIAIASADMLVAASVFYILFPPIHGGYLKVLEVYLVVYVLIVLSHVPGGWGVLEAGMMTLLQTLELVKHPDANLPKVLAAIIVFRVIYFLLPLLFAAIMIGWHELALRREWIAPIAVPPEAEPGGTVPAEGMNGHAGKEGQIESKRNSSGN